MTSEAPSQIASLLQSASLKRNPSPEHDINPSTAASEKVPVHLNPYADLDEVDEAGEDEIPVSLLNPIPRHNHMPPLPDMRFEQSYLKSIENAGDWKGVAWITVRDQVRWIAFPRGTMEWDGDETRRVRKETKRLTLDQVIMCFAQGVVWNLLLHGWRYFNRSTKFSGRSIGARIRRWWWGVNNWKIPTEAVHGAREERLTRNMGAVSAVFLNVRPLNVKLSVS